MDTLSDKSNKNLILFVVERFMIFSKDLVKRLFASVFVHFPSSEDMPLRENLFNLLQGTATSFREHEYDVNRSHKVEDTENEIGDETLSRSNKINLCCCWIVSVFATYNVGKTWRNGKSQCSVECPVGSGAYRNGLPSNPLKKAISWTLR